MPKINFKYFIYKNVLTKLKTTILFPSSLIYILQNAYLTVQNSESAFVTYNHGALKHKKVKMSF